MEKEKRKRRKQSPVVKTRYFKIPGEDDILATVQWSVHLKAFTVKYRYPVTGRVIPGKKDVCENYEEACELAWDYVKCSPKASSNPGWSSPIIKPVVDI